MSVSVSLRHSFADFALDAAFEAPRGVTALFGRSGSGKTTLVNAVAGLLKPDQGHVEVDGEALLDTSKDVALPAHRRRIGYVFQDGRLFPHMSVAANLRYGQRYSDKRGKTQEFDAVVEMLGIGHLVNRSPVSLSGGEKQRVAIGRALLSSPRLLIMDEPLASLDEERKQEILPYLERLRDEAGIPVIYVSHSVSEVARLATTVVILRQGRVAACGPAGEIFADPQFAPAFGIREAGSVLDGKITRHHEDGLTEIAVSGGNLLLPELAGEPGASVRVRISAHEVMLALKPPQDISALNVLPVTVTQLKYGDGPGVLVQLQCGTDRLLARITRRSAQALALAEGAQCHAILKSVSVAQESVWRQSRAFSESGFSG